MPNTRTFTATHSTGKVATYCTANIASVTHAVVRISGIPQDGGGLVIDGVFGSAKAAEMRAASTADRYVSEAMVEAVELVEVADYSPLTFEPTARALRINRMLAEVSELTTETERAALRAALELSSTDPHGIRFAVSPLVSRRILRGEVKHGQPANALMATISAALGKYAAETPGF